MGMAPWAGGVSGLRTVPGSLPSFAVSARDGTAAIIKPNAALL